MFDSLSHGMWNLSYGAGSSTPRGCSLVSLHSSGPLVLMLPSALQDAKFAVVLEEDLDISVDFFR